MIRLHVTLSPRRHASRSRRIGAWALGLAALPVLALASPVAPLTSFEPGDPIVADDFNANFDAIADAVDDNDARIGALEGSSDGGVPGGAVVFFDATECPEGWSELPEARGRAVVGMNGSASTLLGTVGDGLADLEDPEHSHVTDIGSITSSTSSVPHTHPVPGHNTNSGGSHNHQWLNGTGQSFNSGGVASPIGPAPVSPGGGFTLNNYGSNSYYTDNDGSHSHSVAGFNTSTSGNTSHSHAVDPSPTTSSNVSTGDIMPYVQLLACRRNG